MESYFQSISLTGFAAWMRAQVQEEMMHAMKFYDFVNERGGKVTLEAIAKPESVWASPLDAFEAILKHEQHVTSLINDLVDLAIAEKDHATNNFLQWFVSEQVEEEASVGGIVEKLRLIKDNPSGLFMMDNELGKRVFVIPQDAGE
jgi:ferritin